jgi:tetratricopeptide (TPR) repeat protein
MWSFNEEVYRKQVLSPAEGAFRTSGELPDLFTRYALLIDVTDEADIKTAFQTIESFWAKNKGNPKYKIFLPVLAAQKEVDFAHRTLLDPIARKDLREVVEAERKQRLEERFAALDRSLGVVAAKGYITPDDKAHLIARYKTSGLTEAEILSRLFAVRVAEDRAINFPKEGLPKDVRSRIKSNLAAIGYRDLYEFMGVANGSSKNEWSTKHRDLENSWRQKRNDARKTSANELLAIVRTSIIDGDPGAYEEARLWEVLDELRPEVKLAAAGDGQITHAEFKKLVALALTRGIDETTAKDYIVALGKEIPASVEWSSTDDSVGCPNCYTAISIKENADVCPVCSHPLWTKCPRCQTRLPLKVRKCGKCAFAVGDLPRVRLLVRAGELALSSGQVAQAAEAAEEAERMWGRQGNVEVLLKKIEAQQTRIEALRNDINRCIAEQRLYAAKTAVSALVMESPNYSFRDGKTGRELATAIELSLKKIEALLEKGHNCQSVRQLNEAVFAYEAALSIAKDCDAAKDALGRCQPETPGGVRVSLEEADAIAEWTRGPAVGEVRYVLVRQEGHAPTSVSDGVRLCDTTELSFRDNGLRPGAFVFYSVFAERWKAFSAPSTTTGLFTAIEVRKLGVVAGDGIVSGSWENVVPGARVLVTRKEGSAPANQPDGTDIRVTGSQGFVDSTVRNGQIYYYRVSVEYTDPRGGNLMTSGHVVMASPDQPPTPVEDLKIALASGAIELAWSPIARGTVRVYRRTDMPAWQIGARIAASSASDIGTPLGNVATTRAVDGLPPEGIVYYVPVTISGDLAVVGASRRYVSLPEVSALTAQDFGTYLQLQWQWPKDCSFALVSWRADAYPDHSSDKLASIRRVSKGEYEQHGGFRINNPPPTPHRFVVFAGGRIDDTDVFSAGLDGGSRADLRTTKPVQISYQVERGLWHRKQLTLTLSASRTVKSVPDLIIVAKRGDLQPLRADDGSQLALLSGLALSAGQPSTYEFKLQFRPAYIRAFFLEPSAYQGFRLIDPAPSQLKIR